MIIVSTTEKYAADFRRKARYTNDLVKCYASGPTCPPPGAPVGFRSPLNNILAEGEVITVHPGAFMVKVTAYYA